MLQVFLTATIVAAAAADLPLTRATMLRDSGAWLRWEGELPFKDGAAEFRLVGNVDRSTLQVQVAMGNDWRDANFHISEPSRAPDATSTAPQTPTVRVSAPEAMRTAKVRCQGFSNFARWKPSYSVDFTGAAVHMTMRAAIHVDGQLPFDDAAIECVAASATTHKADDRWSDRTRYPLAVKNPPKGVSSIVLFADKVQADVFADVSLGAMVGEPGMKPAEDRVSSVLRIENRTSSAWPMGDLIVSNEGRLIARTKLPHVDAGQTAEGPLGVAVGVSVTREEIELERKTLTARRETDAPDSIQTAGSATIANRSGQTMAIRVTKTVAGDVTAASDDARIVRTPNRLGAEHALCNIRWKFTLANGQSKRITYGTTLRTPPPLEAKDPRP